MGLFQLKKQQTKLAKKIIKEASLKNERLAVGESCTGGIISSLLTSVPGSSKVFDQGLVTYSNKAKIDLLGVNQDTIKKNGAVSKQVVEEMVNGLFRISEATFALSISGVAGPGSLSAQKPEGLVWIAYGHKFGTIKTSVINFEPLGRDYVRQKSSIAALNFLLELLLKP